MSKLQRRAIQNILLILICGGSSSVFGQGNEKNCKALIQINGDLQLINQKNNTMHKITNDGIIKDAIAVSEDGNIIAYSGVSDNSNMIMLIDTNGKSVFNFDARTRNVITGLKWMSSEVLRVQEHISPAHSAYHFFKIKPPVRAVEISNAKGEDCALSLRGKTNACIVGDTIEINGRSVYYLPNALATNIFLQIINTNVGAIVKTSTEPDLIIEITAISNKKIGLNVTTPDGLSELEYVRIGDMMPVKYETGTPAQDSKVTFGLVPDILNSAHGLVSVQVYKGTAEEFYFEGGLGWSQDGRRIAAVESGTSGNHFLTLLSRHRTNEKSFQRKITVETRTPVPLSGPISSVEFVSSDRVRIVGDGQVFEQTIPHHGAISPGKGYTVTAGPPAQIVRANGEAIPVDGWVCQQ